MGWALWERYIVGSVGYGALHKLAILWDGHVDSYDSRKTRPMLLGEKLSAFTIGMVYSPLLSPAWLMNDLDRLDMYMGGKRPEDYGYGRSRYKDFFDYVTG